MKITAVFLSKKKQNNSKIIVNRIKNQNKKEKISITNRFKSIEGKNIKEYFCFSKIAIAII